MSADLLTSIAGAQSPSESWQTWCIRRDASFQRGVVVQADGHAEQHGGKQASSQPRCSHRHAAVLAGAGWNQQIPVLNYEL